MYFRASAGMAATCAAVRSAIFLLLSFTSKCSASSSQILVVIIE